MNITRKDLLCAAGAAAIAVAYATFASGNLPLFLVAVLGLDLIPDEDRAIVRICLPLSACLIGYGVLDTATRGQMAAIPVAAICAVIIMGGSLAAKRVIGRIRARRALR